MERNEEREKEGKKNKRKIQNQIITTTKKRSKRLCVFDSQTRRVKKEKKCVLGCYKLQYGKITRLNRGLHKIII